MVKQDLFQSQDGGSTPTSPLQFEKKEWKVLPCSFEDTHSWIKLKHYAKRIPSITYSFGLYKNNILAGICTFGLPPSPDVCLLFGEKNKTKLIELNRLCVEEGLPKNSLSFFVSKCLKMIPGDKIIISYADSGQQHHGYIYQATNFIYTGLSKKQFDLKIKGTNKHSRHAYDIKNAEVERVERTQKHRYFYFKGSKKFCETTKNLIPYRILPYPKGNNKRYDASFKPDTQQIFF